jgi:hypothetical protein
MTLWLTREGVNVTIHGNTGVDVVVENSQLRRAEITEHYAHMKYFWSQLGEIIKQAEEEEKTTLEVVEEEVGDALATEG